MSDEIVWENPPARTSTRGVKGIWRERLASLVERPHKWTRVYEAGSQASAKQASVNLRSGKVIVPAGEWEFTSRETYVYARYLGPEEG